MTFKELFKAWKHELKAKGLWDKEIWEQPITVGHDRMSIAIPNANYEHGLTHVRLGLYSSEKFGVKPYVEVKETHL